MASTAGSIGSSLVGTLSAPGLGSGLDINSIVGKLMAVESQPLALLDRKEASLQAKISAYGSLKGALSSFRDSVAVLANASNFRGLSAIAADSSIVTATATDPAVPASYAIGITQLAQAQSAYSAAIADTSAVIGAGGTTTLQFQFGTITGGTLTSGRYSGASFVQDGSRASGTVTIDAGNNTLAGIRDAINAAHVGVTASIVSDGTASNRLVLTSTRTGASSSMKISVSGDSAIASLLAQDPAGTQNLSQSVAGQDASLTINGMPVSSASNSVSDAVTGVTFTLAKAGTTNVTVASNTTSAQSAIQGFVKAWNDATGTLKSLTSYDADTKQGGLLLGDATALRIESALRSALGSSVAGRSSGLTLLSQVGISIQKDGTLSLDNSKLQTALSSSLDDVAGLFATAGRASDPLVRFLGAGPLTQPGNHAISVTTLATQGRATGSNALSATTTIDSSNDTLALGVDGTGASITLAHGTYSPAQLAAALQSAINGSNALAAAGASVSVTQSGGMLAVISARFGAVSTVNLSGGNALTALFGTPSIATGTDVSGTIDGAAASGDGQILIAASGSAATGLRIKVLGGSIGARGGIIYSHGVGDRLGTLLENLLANKGLIGGRTDGLQISIENIGHQRDAINRRLATTEARYRAQFTALDNLISSMNSTSSFLTQQLANLPKITAG